MAVRNGSGGNSTANKRQGPLGNTTGGDTSVITYASVEIGTTKSEPIPSVARNL